MEENKNLTDTNNNSGADASYKELAEENKRLKSALKYITLLAEIKDPHLGHPRLSDKNCIFCMAYFALNNGAYGYEITGEEYEQLFEKRRNG
ncbi:MAG: hypothetical protein IPJ03_16090 [Ignavibacteriales bacterium]|nr:hypothetical protein [Ignavibacteriales bacterium]